VEPVLAMILGPELAVLAGASALIGMIFGRCSKRRKPAPPEKQIEITVQRMDRPYRPRPY